MNFFPTYLELYKFFWRKLFSGSLFSFNEFTSDQNDRESLHLLVHSSKAPTATTVPDQSQSPELKASLPCGWQETNCLSH